MKPDDNTLSDWLNELCDEICREKGITRGQFYDSLMQYKEQIETELRESGVDVDRLNELSKIGRPICGQNTK